MGHIAGLENNIYLAIKQIPNPVDSDSVDMLVSISKSLCPFCLLVVLWTFYESNISCIVNLPVYIRPIYIYMCVCVCTFDSCLFIVPYHLT